MKYVLSSFLILILLSSSVIVPSSITSVAFAETSDEINDIETYVIYGLEKVEIDKEVTIQSGNVGLHDDSKKKGEIKIKKDIEFVDSESSVVANKIKIEKDATAPSVYYNELDNKGTILGTENTPLELPVVNNLPDFPDFEAGDEKIKVEKNDSLSLSPGDYGKIEIKKGAMIIFEGGVYNIESIKADKDSQILFEDPSEVRVEKDLKLDKLVTLGPHPDSEITAADIVFFVGDDNKSKIEFDKNSVIHGIFYSPEGEIKIKKEVQATGSFIAEKIKIEKNVTLVLDSGNVPITDLVEEYLTLIEKLDEIGTNIDDLSVTTELIDEIQDDLDRIKQLVIELQMRGYDGEGTTTRINGHTVGTVMFYDEDTGDELFSINVPDGTISIFAIFGYIEEFETNGEFDLQEKISLIEDSFSLAQVLITFDDEDIANTFVLAAIGAYHPSTGNTFVIVGYFVYFAVMQCLANPSCVEAVSEVVRTVVSLVLDEATPIVLITGEEFNDINNDGSPGPGEIGVGGFEYLLGSSGPIVELSANPIESDPQGDFSFKFRVAKSISNFVVVQSERDGWIPNVNGDFRDLTIEPAQNLVVDIEPAFGNQELISPPIDVIFQDDYTTNSGWTQVGTSVTVDSPSFPDRVHFQSTSGGGGVNEKRVFKQLPSTLPSDNWTLEFDYIYSSSQLVANYPAVLTETSNHVERQPSLSDQITLYHGANLDNLRLSTSAGGQSSGDGIDIAANVNHYVSLVRTPTNLELNIFSDPARTIPLPGSPVSIPISTSDFDNLNYIQHSNSFASGSGRILTGDVDNTIIFVDNSPPPPPPPTSVLFQDDFSSGLGNWEYHAIGNSGAVPNPTDNYSPSIDTNDGQPSPSALISGDGFAITSGIRTHISIPNDATTVLLTFDGKAAGTLPSHVAIPNLRVDVYDDNEQAIFGEYVIGAPNPSSSSVTPWTEFTVDLSDAVIGHDSVSVKFGLADSWSANYNQKIWIDNVLIESNTSSLPTPPQNGLLAHWNFDEGQGGTLNDVSGNNRHGAISGATWTDTSCKSGNCLTFDGSGSHVNLPALGLANDDDPYTLSAWVKLNDAQQAIIIGNNDASAPYHSQLATAMISGPDSKLGFGFWKSQVWSVDIRTDANALDQDTLHHVLVTYDGSRSLSGMEMYLDGEQQAYTFTGGHVNEQGDFVSSANPVDNWFIGRWDNSNFLNGVVDEVLVYDRVLTPSEILSLSN